MLNASTVPCQKNVLFNGGQHFIESSFFENFAVQACTVEPSPNFNREVSGGNFWGEQHHEARRFVLDYGGTAELACRGYGEYALFGVGGVKFQAAAGYFHDGTGADCGGVA